MHQGRGGTTSSEDPARYQRLSTRWVLKHTRMAPVSAELLKMLAGYGILGIVSVLAVLFAGRKDKEANEAQAEVQEIHNSYQETLEEVRKPHRVETQAILDRYMSKSET